MTTATTNLDVLRAYTAQFGVEVGPDETFMPHEPVSADAAAEVVRNWVTGSVTSGVTPDGGIATLEPRRAVGRNLDIKKGTILIQWGVQRMRCGTTRFMETILLRP